MLERELAVLGLKPGAGETEIRSAYRNLAKKYHPDTSGQNTAAIFLRVTHAYKNLTIKDGTSKIVDYPVREPFRKAEPVRNPVKDPVAVMGKVLLKGCSQEQRIFAARQLGNSGKKTAYSYLKKALADKDPLVVKSTIEAIGKLKVYQSSGDLSNVFTGGGEEIRLEVLKAVENINLSGGFHNIILQAMKDPSQIVRMKGVSLFAKAVHARRCHG